MEHAYRIAASAGLLCAVLAFAWVAPAGAIEPSGVTKLTASVPSPDDVEGAVAAKTRRNIGERVVERIRARLDAADIKFSSVNLKEHGVVEIRADGDVSRELLAGIALAPGELELRRVRHIGGRWVRRSGEIPDGVRIRQSEGSLDRSHAYLWSAQRSSLASYLEGVSMEDVDVLPYATPEGWRSVSLGEVVATEEVVTASSVEREETGAAFVSLELDAEGQGALRSVFEHEDGRLAMVLDGEVVACVERGTSANGQLDVAAPSHLAGDEARDEWARQVAGRLAASIPVTLIPHEE